MTGNYYGNPIIRTVPGNQTGDVWHQTADGRWWKEVSSWRSNSEPATGVTRGQIRGNAIYPNYGG